MSISVTLIINKYLYNVLQLKSNQNLKLRMKMNKLGDVLYGLNLVHLFDITFF